MEKFILNAENKFDMNDAFLRWAVGYTRAQQMADMLCQNDIIKIANLCGGDFYRLSAELMEAIGIKAKQISERCKEQAKVRKARRAEIAADFHKQIMAEIRELMGNTETFTAEQVQLTAYLKNFYVVRSIPMYAAHMQIACNNGEAKKCITWHDNIKFIYGDHNPSRAYSDTRISTGRALYSLI